MIFSSGGMKSLSGSEREVGTRRFRGEWTGLVMELERSGASLSGRIGSSRGLGREEGKLEVPSRDELGRWTVSEKGEEEREISSNGEMASRSEWVKSALKAWE